MPFEAPTLEETVEFERAQYRALIPGADTSDGSDYDIASRVHGTALRGVNANATYIGKQVNLSTIDGDHLLEACSVRGITPQPAAAATGKALLSSTTNGDTQLSGSALTHASGLEYTTTTAGVTATAGFSGLTVGDGSTAARIAVVGGVGSLSVDMPVTVGTELCVIRSVISAIDAFEPYVPLSAAPTTSASITPACGVVVSIAASAAGANGNQSTRETLTLASPAGDIAATVSILQLSGGGDDETEAELRGRLLDFEADRPGSGNLSDYRDWARTAPGVRCDDAFVYAGIYGLGSVAVVPFGVAGARYLSDEAAALVADNITARAHFADDWTVHQGNVTGNDFSLEISVTPGAGYEPDNDAGTFDTHASTPCTTTRIYTATPASSYEIGDRVAVPLTVGGITTRYERALSIVMPTYVEVAEALPSAPGTSVRVCSSGPLWQSLYDAIYAAVDNLGPGDTTPPTRYPPSSVAHPSELHEAAVLAAGMAVTGVTTLTATPSTPFPLEPGALSRVRMTSLEISWT